VGFRHKADSISWAKEDEAELLGWARRHCPAAVVTSTPAPKDSLLKEPLIAMRVKGELVPRTLWRTAGDEFYYRGPKEKDDE